jgi:hypothetical protein
MIDHIDGRPARYSDNFTSAASHPELLTGDLAMRPRRFVGIMPPGGGLGAIQWRRRFGLIAAVALVTLLSAIMLRTAATSDDSLGERHRLGRTCLQWHLAAGAVVSRLAQSTRDADLAQAASAAARMRRARESCEAGELISACQDYEAVTTNLPRHAAVSQLFPCARATEFDLDRN